MNKIVMITLFFLLSSCSLLSPIKPEAVNSYLLTKTPHLKAQKNRSKLILLIYPPSTRSIYNTTQMAYTIQALRLNYFVKNEWADTPGAMFLPLLLKSLQQTHFFHAIVMPPYVGYYDYALNIYILELQQNMLHFPGSLRFQVNVQLIRSVNQKIIATKLITIEKKLKFQTPYDGVIAANSACVDILKAINRFVKKAIPEK
jgi:cholesterol transport system auxiliary component